MDESVWLIEIHRRFHVIWDYAIVLPRLGDTIDLNRQQHRNPQSIQFARQKHDRRRSPAVSEQNDACLGFFLVAEDPIVIPVEEAKNRLIRGLTVTILKNPNVGILGKIQPGFRRQLDRALIRVIPADKAPDKTDNNIPRRGKC